MDPRTGASPDRVRGRFWKKVKSWFGYGLHLIADTDYEVPVAFEVTRASTSEPKVLSGMLEELFARAPEMAGRCADFSADRGLDDGRLKARLWDRWVVRPLIDTRLMWWVEKEERRNGILTPLGPPCSTLRRKDRVHRGRRRPAWC